MGQVLIIGPSWIGDMMMAQSLFKAVKARSADTQISVLAPQWSAPLLHRMPEVSNPMEMPVGHGALQLGVRRKLAKTIRHHRFDQAIVLPGSFKSALIPWFAGIPKRTGFIGEQRWGLLNDIRKLDKPAMPQNVQRYVALAMNKNEGINNTVIENIYKPKLAIDDQAVERALTRFGLHRDKPVLALCPGAEFGPAKRWPARHFAQVAKSRKSRGWQVWLFGSGKDRAITASLNAMSGDSCIDLAGRTSLGEAADLMSCARFVVTNDSGLMHIAAALDCHVIAIYGSSSDQFTPPLTKRCDRLNLHLSCSPCFKRECPLGHLNCLNQLLPQQIIRLIPDCPGL